MMTKLFLFKVEDHFQVSNWGLVVAPGIPIELYEGPRDVILLLKKPNGNQVEEVAEIFYSFPKPTPAIKMLTVLFPHLTKEDVPIGTEIWLTKENGSSQLEKLFWKLCEAADVFEQRNYDLPLLEPFLLKILNFVKNNQEHEKLFKNCFLALATKCKFTDWIVLYCMRELKYLEIREAINKQFHDLGGPQKAPRLKNFVSDTNKVYNDPLWGGTVFF